MAVLGRLLVSSAERLDLPDLLSIDSYAAGDWKYYLNTVAGTISPYVITGFNIIDAPGAIGTQTCSINISSSAMYFPGSSAGSFFYGLPPGDPNAQPLVPELRQNATNYVYLTLTTMNTSQDSRAFWDPDANVGVGGEFTQEVNTESVIQVQVNVSTGSFPANTMPVAIVVVGSSTISSITDARPMMFRLGSGGIAPNPDNRFAWPSLPSAPYQRLETPITINSPSAQDPFEGGDKNILSMKEWMDAVMSKLAELGGTEFWYENTSAFSIVSIFHDALATTFKSKGAYVHSSSTPGLLTYTEDVLVMSVSDPREYIIRQGAITIPNEDVAYIPLVRDQPINPLDAAVAWFNGQAYVNTPNGSIGFFANLSQGDWIKKIGDDATLFLRVEQFYDTVNLGGSVTTAANAKSIRLSAAYQGTTATDFGRYDKGVYLSTDILIQPRTDAAISAAGGNFMWFALRSDTVEGIASISSVTLSGTLATGNGSAAQITSTAHGLINGDRVTITLPVAYAGTYTVDVADVNTFFINTAVTSAGGALTAFYGLLTTAATTNGYGLQLESADHGFESGEEIFVTNTTNWNGNYTVNVRSATQVQIPVGSAFGTETSGNATLARLDVRTEEGITKVVQGETIDIGEKDSENIQHYIGMTSLAETSPNYFIPAGYNTFSYAANYNGTPTDNLTLRTAQLTAMMADKAQDKVLKYLCNANTAINTTNGSAQQLTFQPASSTLTILQPGTSGNAVVSLPSGAPGISLLANQSAYVVINRNSATTPTIVVANTASILPDENIIVIASRLNDADGAVYLWNGELIIDAANLVPSSAALVKAKYFNPINQTLPTGNPVVMDGINLNAGELVLFSNLLSGNNQIYMAIGSGTNITGWQVQYLFNGLSTPASADTVIIQEGNSFQDQVGKFNDTTWAFNDKVRYFGIQLGGSASYNYFEQDAIAVTALADNTTNGTVFSVAYTGSEYQIIDFSLNRGTSRETGTLYVTSDGVNANVTEGGAYLNTSGVTFDAVISGGNFILRYTSSSTGSAATMKFMVRRWSNLSGGPQGVPSYTGATPSVAAFGPANSIQYNNGGLLDGSANFLIDTASITSADNGSFQLNGLNQTTLSSGITILDNQLAPVTLFTYPKASYPFAIFEYSILRNGSYRTGRLLVANDGAVTAESDDYVNTNPVGVSFSSTIIGANVAVQYTSTSTGFNATFKYSGRVWT